MKRLTALPARVLLELATALGTGRVCAPFSTFMLQRYVDFDDAVVVGAELSALHESGASQALIAQILIALAERDPMKLRGSTYPELVISGPEAIAGDTRSTAAVVSELFSSAKESVLVAGYAVHSGQRVFDRLASRMQEIPELDVRLCLDVRRNWSDTRPSDEIVSAFRQDFEQNNWPVGAPLPPMFHYRGSLELPIRGSLHAKCVVVDRKRLFITSANFTPRAQERNVEAGILITSLALASEVVDHFDRLIRAGELAPV